MIARIAKKEFTEMTRDGRFRWAFAVVMVLLLVSLALGWKHYRDVDAQHQEAQRTTRKQWLEQGDKNPHGAAHYGVYAFKPKMPLSLVDQGVDAYTGVAVWLEAHKQNDFKFRPAQDATALARFGELSAAAVLQSLVPLLIIVLAFPAFAGERDLGTLRQVMSLGVPARDLAIGKALGVSSALGILIVPATVIGVAAIGLASGPVELLSETPRLVMMGVGYLLYFGAFLALSLTVSALSESSRSALLVLLGFWIVNCLIVPRASADLARRLHPTPSALAFSQSIDNEVRQGINSHDPSNRGFQELKARVLKEYGVDREEDLPVSFAGIALQEGEEYGYRIFDEHFAKLWGTFAQQDRVHRTAALFSPFLAVRSLSMGTAGTDSSQHRDFADAAEQYRRAPLIKVINDDVTQHGKAAGAGYTAGADLWEKVPEFQYESPGFRSVVAAQWPDLAVLAAWFVVAAGVAVAATARVRVS